MEKITGTVITLNEERHIVACVESLLRVCDEVIVVDSDSSDRTRELAEAAGARVYVQPYLGDGPQKNYALQFATHRWVLTLDADERMDDDMVASIKALDLSQTRRDAFMFKRKSHIGKRWIRRCGWYPDWLPRLYDMERTRFAPVIGHAKVEAHDAERLAGNIIHYAYPDYHGYEQQMNRFSTRGAGMLYEAGRRAGAWTPVTHGIWTFFRAYFMRGGFLQGLDGLTVSRVMAHHSYMKYAKLIELERHRDKPRQ